MSDDAYQNDSGDRCRAGSHLGSLVEGSRMMALDRWIGVFLVTLAVAIGIAASGYEVGFVVDPLGPKALPFLVAGLFLAGGGVLLGRRIPASQDTLGPRIPASPNTIDPPVSASEAPLAPRLQTWRSQALSLAVLVAYAVTLPLLGFVAGTALASGVLSRVFGGRFLPGLAVGLVFGLGLFSLFAVGFGLELPAGILFGWVA